MENNDLQFIYEQLRDKYNLVLTNAFALDAGFDKDFQVLYGESQFGKFYLYMDFFLNRDYEFNGDYEYVFSVDLPNGKYTHWHPQTKEEATDDVVAIMEGTADWL